jgi:hypothetical protein
MHISPDNNNELGDNCHLSDSAKIPGLLFNYNGSVYYGHGEVVYDSIQIKNVVNFDQPITLSGHLPRYVIDLWIESMYSKRFDLMKIKPSDIIKFLDHIDQYPFG